MARKHHNTKQMKCRCCQSTFRLNGYTEASYERCCSKNCLEKVGPWLPIHGPCRKPKNWAPNKEPRIKRKKHKPNRHANDSFFKGSAWLELRYKVLEKYGRTCMLCNRTSGQMHVDHIKPRSKYPDLALNFDNLQVLCHECNKGKSNKSQTDFRYDASTPHVFQNKQ